MGLTSQIHDKISSSGEEVESDDRRTPPPPVLPSLSQKQKVIFIAMGITYICMQMSFSILAPFYPIEARKKGVSTTVTGLVFGCFHAVIFITSPIVGKYVPVLGAKFLFLTGVGVGASCNIIFGFLHYIEDTELFIVICFVVRAIEAIGVSSTMTAAMAIVPGAFPNHVAQIVGAMETCLGLGLMAGPAIGSLFYKIGGYILPFIILGSVSWITVFVNVFIIPSVGRENRTSGSVMDILTIPSVYPTIIGIVVGGASIIFLEPTLPIHLSSYHVPPETTGLIFLLAGATYGATNPLWGYVADRWNLPRTLMVPAFFFLAVAILMVGPPNLPFIPQELWIILIGIALAGVALACVMPPSFLDLVNSAVWYGLPNDMSTFGVISGLFNSSFSLGSTIGPVLGGYLVDKIGFKYTTTAIAGLNLIVMVLMFLFSCWEFQCGKRRRPPLRTISNTSDTSNEEDERKVLLRDKPSK